MTFQRSPSNKKRKNLCMKTRTFETKIDKLMKLGKFRKIFVVFFVLTVGRSCIVIQLYLVVYRTYNDHDAIA
jgi:hypothetical protein